jgi:hypothetical protein
LQDIELVEEILRLQNTVCYLQAQLREERQMNARHIIHRMCAAPLVIQYVEGEILHTDDKPFCLDPACPCHEDREAVNAVNEAVEAGILTKDEATRLIAGKQLER